MGLLDSIGLDPGTLALAGGLLSPGSFGQGLARGVEGSQNAQLRQQQIAEAVQAQQMRELQMQRTRQQLQFGSTFLNDTGTPSTTNLPSTMPAASAALANGAQTGSLGPTPQNAAAMGQMAQPTTVTPQQKSRLGQLTQDQIAAGVVSGVIPKELVELWQNEKFGRALPSGWKQNLDGSMIYVPDPTKGITIGPDGKTVMPMPGAADTLGTIAAATKGGEMRATNQNTPIPLDRIDRGLPQGVTPFSTVDDLLNGQQTRGAPLSAQPPGVQRMVAASAGGQPATFNGQPITPATPGAFKTPAQMSAEKIIADNQANLVSQPAVTSAVDRAKAYEANDKDYAAALNTRVQEGFALKKRNAEILAQMADYKTGMASAESRTKLASNLINMFPGDQRIHDLADTINGGSVPSAQTFNNLVAGAMITNAIQVLQGQGRLNKAEVQKFSEAAESAATDPGALKRIMAIQNRFADQDFAEQQARAKAIKDGSYNPATWQADFAAKQYSGMNDPTSVFAPATPAKPTLRFNMKTGKIEAAQ